MRLNIGKEITALRRMTVPELRGRYAEVFGEETTSRHKDYMIRRILWKLQANAEGDLSERARQRAKELLVGADVRLTAPVVNPVQADPDRVRTGHLDIPEDGRLPMPGATITRKYKGQLIEVRILPKGFEFEGEIYRSLSAVAKAATGTHWNGYHFFRLGKKGGQSGEEER